MPASVIVRHVSAAKKAAGSIRHRASRFLRQEIRGGRSNVSAILQGVPEARWSRLCWVPHFAGANSERRAYTQRRMQRQFSASQSASSNGAFQQCAQEATCEDARALAQR